MNENVGERTKISQVKQSESRKSKTYVRESKVQSLKLQTQSKLFLVLSAESHNEYKTSGKIYVSNNRHHT